MLESEYPRRRLMVAVGVLLVAASTGCASHAAGAREVVSSGERSSRYVLVPADIEKVKADNVYDVIAKLRPEFLRGHGDPNSFVNQPISGGRGDPGLAGASVTGAGTAVVKEAPAVIAYRDKARLSSVDDLKLMTLATVAEIRYIPGPEAGVKYGTNHSGGVILVTSK